MTTKRVDLYNPQYPVRLHAAEHAWFSYQVPAQAVREFARDVRDYKQGTDRHFPEFLPAQNVLDETWRPNHTTSETELMFYYINHQDGEVGAYQQAGILTRVKPENRPRDLTGYCFSLQVVDQAFTWIAGHRLWGFPKVLGKIEDPKEGYVIDLRNLLHLDPDNFSRLPENIRKQLEPTELAKLDPDKPKPIDENLLGGIDKNELEKIKSYYSDVTISLPEKQPDFAWIEYPELPLPSDAEEQVKQWMGSHPSDKKVLTVRFPKLRATDELSSHRATVSSYTVKNAKTHVTPFVRESFRERARLRTQKSETAITPIQGHKFGDLLHTAYGRIDVPKLRPPEAHWAPEMRGEWGEAVKVGA